MNLVEGRNRLASRLYYMIFDPQTYPMNWSWVTGHITEEDFRLRHPVEYERITGRKAETKSDPRTEEEEPGDSTSSCAPHGAAPGQRDRTGPILGPASHCNASICRPLNPVNGRSKPGIDRAGQSIAVKPGTHSRRSKPVDLRAVPGLVRNGGSVTCAHDCPWSGFLW